MGAPLNPIVRIKAITMREDAMYTHSLQWENSWLAAPTRYTRSARR